MQRIFCVFCTPTHATTSHTSPASTSIGSFASTRSWSLASRLLSLFFAACKQHVAAGPFLCPLLFVIMCVMNTSLLLTAHSFSLHLVSIYNHMRPFRGKRTRTRTHAVWRHPEFKQSMNISWVRQMRNLCHTNSQLPTHLHSLWWGGAGKAEGR